MSCDYDCESIVITEIEEEYLSKCQVILLWASKKRPSFNNSFILSILDQYERKEYFTSRQKQAIDNIITKFRIPYDGNCMICNNTGIGYLSVGVYGKCFQCSKYDNFLR